MDIKRVNDGTLNEVIEKYNIKTVEELKIYAQVYEDATNRTVAPAILSAITKAGMLEGYYPKNIENLKVNIDKFNSTRFLPFDFKLGTFKFAYHDFPTVYQIKNADHIRGIGKTKQEIVDGALKLYQDRIDTLIFKTPEKELNVDILTRGQEEKLKVVNSSSMIWDLLSSSDNFVWGSMDNYRKGDELRIPDSFAKMVESYIAMYNDMEDLIAYKNGINDNAIKKFTK